jgi:hypothetical protein
VAAAAGVAGPAVVVVVAESNLQFLPMKFVFFSRLCVTAVAVTGLFTTSLQAADFGQSFATPEEAVATLSQAAGTTNLPALRALFGADGDYLINADPVMAANEASHFAAQFNESHQLITESPTRRVLQVGLKEWPFPVPIVLEDGRWHFDSLAGREEILDRRIGANELNVLQTLRAFVAAQREYAGIDRDGDEVLEFAQMFLSSPGQKDGLYWPADLDGSESPLGPLVAAAQEEGYKTVRKAGLTPQPFHGYFFRILKRQGEHAPGGAYGYVINGNMIGGFAAIAWPAEYGETGIMTFIVNQQGRVYQRDLGEKTAKKADAISAYDPGKGWTLSKD